MAPDSAQTPSRPGIRTCPCCGLLQRVPPAAPGLRARCARCRTCLQKRTHIIQGNRRAAAVALAALVLYPAAVTLPMLQVEKFGYHTDASILQGVRSLIEAGHLIVGVIVLLCSIVLPLGKLIALLVLSAGGWFLRHEHRALTYRVVEFTGRWGMLDVLLVALLVAALKMGDFVQVSAGPAALAFTACVVLSLVATALFDPHTLWSAEPAEQTA